MKIFLSTILLAALTVGLARAENDHQPYNYRSCANNNSEACRNARDAFANQHDGQTPEQWNHDWYQGQQGRWNRKDNNWQWQGADGDDWYQGRQGHWYQEPEGWQWRGDQGDEYRKGRDGWQWSGMRQEHDRDRD